MAQPYERLTYSPVSDYPNSLQRRSAYDGSNNLIYLGYAEQGVASSEAKWTIYKFTYSSGLETLKQTAVNAVWDDRASLTYS